MTAVTPRPMQGAGTFTNRLAAPLGHLVSSKKHTICTTGLRIGLTSRRYDNLCAGGCGEGPQISLTWPTGTGARKGLQYVYAYKISSRVFLFRIRQVVDEAITITNCASTTARCVDSI